MSSDPRTVRIEFASHEEFRREYKHNISNGGIFVATNATFEPRDPIRVEIALPYCNQKLVLGGEVVHCIPPELAAAGGQAGVAVQIDMAASELRARLEPLLGEDASDDESRDGRGKRRTPRTAVSLRARVLEHDRGARDAHTRDLSRGGVLVAVEGEPVPVGDAVQLVLAHPTSGEEMEVGGRVVRHVRENGAVALAVEFDVSEKRRARVERFVDEIRAAEHSKRLGGIQGAISELGIENLLQMFGTCSQAGTLRLRRGDEEALVVFEGGLLRAARLGEIHGRKALGRMLTWREGRFEFTANVDEQPFHEPPLPLDAAIFDAMRLLDEERRPDRPRLSPEMRLAIDRAAVDAVRSDLSKTEEAIVDLASVGLSVAKVVDVIPEPDAEVHNALCLLVERGLVVVRD